MEKLINEKISGWKIKYGSIYKLELDEIYIYYILNIKQCIEIRSLIESGRIVDAEEQVLSYSLLFPTYNEKKFNRKPAGIISILINSIMMSAGFFSDDSLSKLLEDTLTWVNKEFNDDMFQWKLLIMQTLSGYTLDKLDSLIPFEFFKLIRICEKITNQSCIQSVKSSVKSSAVSNKKTKAVALTEDNSLSSEELLGIAKIKPINLGMDK